MAESNFRNNLAGCEFIREFPHLLPLRHRLRVFYSTDPSTLVQFDGHKEEPMILNPEEEEEEEEGVTLKKLHHSFLVSLRHSLPESLYVLQNVQTKKKLISLFRVGRGSWDS